MNVGPMINGYLKNELAGSGMVVWTGREMHAAGKLDDEGLVDLISRGYVESESSRSCN
jgi:dihydroxy-acid dehydratase